MTGQPDGHAAGVPEGTDVMERIVVGMSGGVDSSVAAALLVERGHEVVGVTSGLALEESADPVRRFGSCCLRGDRRGSPGSVASGSRTTCSMPRRSSAAS
jgi:hypothetical protein